MNKHNEGKTMKTEKEIRARLNYLIVAKNTMTDRLREIGLDKEVNAGIQTLQWVLKVK